MKNEDIAKHLTEKLFELGSEDREDGLGQCQRIQFVAGEYPDSEHTQGGLCRVAFEGFVLRALAALEKADE